MGHRPAQRAQRADRHHHRAARHLRPDEVWNRHRRHQRCRRPRLGRPLAGRRCGHRFGHAGTDLPGSSALLDDHATTALTLANITLTGGNLGGADPTVPEVGGGVRAVGAVTLLGAHVTGNRAVGTGARRPQTPPPHSPEATPAAVASPQAGLSRSSRRRSPATPPWPATAAPSRPTSRRAPGVRPRAAGSPPQAPCSCSARR